MVLRGAMAALKAYKEAARGDTVDAEVLKSRIMTCKGCPQYRKRSGLAGRISSALGRSVNKNKVPDAIKDYACGVCGCSLVLLAPSKTPHQDTEAQADLRPASCWMNKENS